MPLMLASDIIVQSTKEGIEDNAVSIVVPDAVYICRLRILWISSRKKRDLQRKKRD